VYVCHLPKQTNQYKEYKDIIISESNQSAAMT